MSHGFVEGCANRGLVIGYVASTVCGSPLRLSEPATSSLPQVEWPGWGTVEGSERRILLCI